MEPRIVYLHHGESDPPKPFRTGAAGWLWVGEDGSFESDTRVRLSANTTHALLGHGVVDALNALAIEGRVGDGEQALIPPAALESACGVFYEADRKTYGGTWEFLVASVREPQPTEFRVRVDNREYQAALARLTFLTSTASRAGVAVWLQI